jgi:mRNA-degrading endonuclease RelE of RelBE toxin-antitoxin system
MKVRVDNPAALRTLDAEDRKKAEQLIDRFARGLDGGPLKAVATRQRPDSVYAFTSGDLRVFFAIDLGEQTVSVIDVAKPSWFGRNTPPKDVIRVEGLLA